MLAHSMMTDHPLASQPIYMSCCVEDLIAVEMDAWKRGYDRAVMEEATTVRDMVAVECAGKTACDEALLVYVPMDLTRFQDVFIRAWCGGYCTRLQEPGNPVASTISQ